MWWWRSRRWVSGVLPAQTAVPEGGEKSCAAYGVHTHVSIRRLKQMHQATHPAAHLQRTGAAQENERAELLATLDEDLQDED